MGNFLVFPYYFLELIDRRKKKFKSKNFYFCDFKKYLPITTPTASRANNVVPKYKGYLLMGANAALVEIGGISWKIYTQTIPIPINKKLLKIN